LVELASRRDFFEVIERPQHLTAVDDLAQLETVVVEWIPA
jgi:hypothetical protein